MKHKMSYIFFLLFLFVTIPYLITVSMTNRKEKQEIDFSTYDSGYTVTTAQKTMDLERYILGILPEQISMDCEEEAIKAQVVILRTDIVRRMEKKKTINEKQLPYKYQTDQELEDALGKKKFNLKDQERKRVVGDTLGEIITYKNQYIDPYFHGISVGTTLSAKEWFGKEIPYLKAKDSLDDVEAPEYMSIKLVTYKQIIDKLKQYKKMEVKQAVLEKELTLKNTTKNGYVKQVQAGDCVIAGQMWAQWFQLASNNFYLEPYDGKIRIICLGKGNGLGMSQYGANEMAKNKKGYKKILKYYYTGIEIKELSE